MIQSRESNLGNPFCRLAVVKSALSICNGIFTNTTHSRASRSNSISEATDFVLGLSQ